MLYSFNAYKEIVMDTLKREVGADSVKEIVIVKTSGVKRIGVRFLVGNKFSPVLYFNTEKEIYSDNDIDEFVRWGLDTCNAPEKHTEKGLDGLLDWNDAKEHVKIRLLSGSKNEEQLKEDYQKDIKAYTDELSELKRELKLCESIEQRAVSIQNKVYF